MSSTFNKTKQAAARLPDYLGEDGEELRKEFEKHLDSFQASFNTSKERARAAQTLCELFEQDSGLERILQKPDSEIIHKELYECMLRIRTALSRENRLADFLRILKSPSPGTKKRASSKSSRQGGSGRPPSFSYKDIRQYQEHHQKEQIDLWKSEALVEDDGDHANLAVIMERGLLDKNIHTPNGDISYDGFYAQKIETMEETVIVLQGKLGVGKSQLSQYIVLQKIVENEDNIILFIGQRGSSYKKEGWQLLKAFKSQLFKRGRKTTGKFYIIIDEPEADHWHWTKSDWTKLYNAAKFYQSKIILLIRDNSNDRQLLQLLPPTTNIIQLLEAPKAPALPLNWEQFVDQEKIPDALLEELRRLPLSRLPIDNCLWRLSCQQLDPDIRETLISRFCSAYALIDHLYVTRFRDKEAHTGVNKKTEHDEAFYRQCDKMLQHIALKLCENGGTVSWTEGTPDQSHNWDRLLNDGFIENIIKIQPRKGELSQGTITGFQHRSFYFYFLTREIRDRLTSGEELKDILQILVRIFETADPNDYTLKILIDGLIDLPNDLKRKARENLSRFEEENKTFSGSPYRRTVASLIELLSF